jgi:hypothetical protein
MKAVDVIVVTDALWSSVHTSPIDGQKLTMDFGLVLAQYW